MRHGDVWFRLIEPVAVEERVFGSGDGLLDYNSVIAGDMGCFCKGVA